MALCDSRKCLLLTAIANLTCSLAIRSMVNFAIWHLAFEMSKQNAFPHRSSLRNRSGPPSSTRQWKQPEAYYRTLCRETIVLRRHRKVPLDSDQENSFRLSAQD